MPVDRSSSSATSIREDRVRILSDRTIHVFTFLAYLLIASPGFAEDLYVEWEMSAIHSAPRVTTGGALATEQAPLLQTEILSTVESAFASAEIVLRFENRSERTLTSDEYILTGLSILETEGRAVKRASLAPGVSAEARIQTLIDRESVIDVFEIRSVNTGQIFQVRKAQPIEVYFE